MKTRFLKSILALAMMAMSLPMMGQDYVNVCKKNGEINKFLLDNMTKIFTSKTDAQGNQYSDYQFQHVTTSNREYVYNLDDIYSLTFIREKTPEIPDGFVDLGLPSGTLWASCNIGANSPEEYGEYINWNNAQSYGCPSIDEIEELIENCTEEWITLNGVKGQKFVSNINGNSIFLPAAGYRYGYRYDAGKNGNYWSSTRWTDYGQSLYIEANEARTTLWDIDIRQSVRPVIHDISLSTTAVTVMLNDEASVKIIYGYGGYTAESDNEKIATACVNDNTSVIIKGVSVGTASITVKDTKSGQTATITVIVMETINHEVYLGEAIDLGLPSGTKWANCNVGATQPEEYGGYYAWGETEEKDYYYWYSYSYYDGLSSSCKDLGSDISGTEYDVAHVKCGGKWCMPTLDDFNELGENCSQEYTTLNGVSGTKFTSKFNGNSIFLPNAGYKWLDALYEVGTRGYIWSSTQYDSGATHQAYGLSIAGYYYWSSMRRYYGRSVRPVIKN
jgi:uncharacterized protein (TIGR02145 family)